MNISIILVAAELLVVVMAAVFVGREIRSCRRLQEELLKAKESKTARSRWDGDMNDTIVG